MIQTHELIKTFDGFFALNGASLHAPKGSIYGLVGPNGAGKTTIIRHIAGVMRPDRGEVSIDGQPVDENDAIKARMFHIPDDLWFFPSANILEMKRFYKQTYPLFDDALFEKLREVFPLNVKQHIRRFSRGMQKQAAFWLGICCRPDVLLLDEPVDGLDPVMRRRVWSLVMQDVADREATVLISSHNLRELEDVCDHVGIMHQGKVILERNLSELQGNLTKLQIAFANSEAGTSPLSEQVFDILHHSSQGRLHTYILRGKQDEISQKVETMNPLLYDLLPLSLEEIFIYELGGLDYAEIIL